MRDEAQVRLGDVLEYSAGVGCEWRHCNTVRNQKDLRTAAYLLRASAARRPGGETFRYRLVRDGRVLDGECRTTWPLLQRVAAALTLYGRCRAAARAGRGPSVARAGRRRPRCVGAGTAAGGSI